MLNILFYCFVAAVGLVGLYLLGETLLRAARRVGAAYLRFRGTRVVVCPETRKYVAVEVDAPHAAATAARGRSELRLTSCTRWPEREGCDQDCVWQIERAPEDCAARSMLAAFYEGKSCALCHDPIPPLRWDEHHPALLRRADRRTLEWGEVPAETLPVVLSTHLPVCWDCHVAETFRLAHPELVTDRDSRLAAHV